MNTPATTLPTPKKPRRMHGKVVRRSGDKTVAVVVVSVKVHPVYHKRSKVSKKYLVHDPKNAAQVGDTVTIQEHRPLSRRKRWMLVSKES